MLRHQNKRIARPLDDDAQPEARSIHELLSEDLADHGRYERLQGNRHEVQVLFAALCDAFPDLNMDRVETPADGDDLAITCKMTRGTSEESELSAIRSAGDETGTVRKWKNCRERAALDKLRLLRQLDAIHA